MGRPEARGPRPGRPWRRANSPAGADSENAGAPIYDDIGCSLTIRSRAVRGRASRPRPAHRRTAVNQRRTPGFARRGDWLRSARGIGVGRRGKLASLGAGGLASFGAGDWLRLAPAIGFVWRRRRQSGPAGRIFPNEAAPFLHARVRSAHRGAGLASLGAAGIGFGRAREIGFARRRRIGFARRGRSGGASFGPPGDLAPIFDPKPKRTHDQGDRRFERGSSSR